MKKIKKEIIEEEKPDTWTITVEFTVFAGDMGVENVKGNALPLLEEITDGTDFAGYHIIKAEREEF